MKIGFEDKYVIDSIFDTAMLKLKQDEIARICCIDLTLDCIPAHWVTIGDEKTRDKRNGYHACHGNMELMYGMNGAPGTGVDTVNCPYCAKASNKGAVDLPMRRFGINIIRYVTDPKGQLRTPLQIDVLGWKFSEGVYRRLMTIKNTYGPLQGLDLTLLCEGEKFQKFQIDPYPSDKCLWLTSGDEFKMFVVQKFKQDKQPSLIELLANHESKDKSQDIANAAMGIGPAFAGGSSNGAPMAVASQADLQKLLDGGPVPTAPTVPAQAATTSPIAPPPQAQPAQQAAPAEAAKPATQNFMDLLK